MAFSVTTTPTVPDAVETTETCFRFTVDNVSKLDQAGRWSSPVTVRHLPWKLKVRENISNLSWNIQPETRALAVFLFCASENKSSYWSCRARAEIKLLSSKQNLTALSGKLSTSLFDNRGPGWGFKNFISWTELVDLKKGFIKDDKIILEVHLTVEEPHGYFWDSKMNTSFTGLISNKCRISYINALLQILYSTNQLRKAVFNIPIECEHSTKSVAWALQCVFHDLQFSKQPVDIEQLSKHFGWEKINSFLEHDIPEFLRVLLNEIESKMLKTENVVPLLFEGKKISFIKHEDGKITIRRSQHFYGVQLNIEGKKSLHESLNDYIGKRPIGYSSECKSEEENVLDGENRVLFIKFPPVLHLHLKRFKYNFNTSSYVKLNNRFEFDEHVNLDEYLVRPEESPADYTLHAVLVLLDDSPDGHYVAYINTKCDGNWLKFDDEVVKKCEKSEAVDKNYGGGNEDLDLSSERCSSASMLIYVRDSAISTVLKEVEDSDIPSELVDRIAIERQSEEEQSTQCNKTYVHIKVLLEECFERRQINDLMDLDKCEYRVFKMEETQTIAKSMTAFKKAFSTPASHMRLWSLQSQQYQLEWSTDFLNHKNKAIASCAKSPLSKDYVLYLELLLPDSDQVALPPFNEENDVVLVFKFHDPVMNKLQYCGRGYNNITQKVCDLIPDLNKRIGFPIETELNLYEQDGSVVRKITYLDYSFEKLNIIKFAVIIFEKTFDYENLGLATCEDNFEQLLYGVEIIFNDKTKPIDAGFTLKLSTRMTYEQMANAVGEKIGVNSDKIQFFKSQITRVLPGVAISSTYAGSLKELLLCETKLVKRLFYQVLPKSIHEWENRIELKCLWLSPNMKDEKELVLYPIKSGIVKEVIEEAKKLVKFSDDGTRQLRMVAIEKRRNCRVLQVDQLLESFCQSDEIISPQTVHRFEEIAPSELKLAEDEMLIPVSHFYKNVADVFGIPFFVRLKEGEPFRVLKDRIQNKLGVSDKKLEMYKFALISAGQGEYIKDENIVLKLSQFTPGSDQFPRSYLALDHVNQNNTDLQGRGEKIRARGNLRAPIVYRKRSSVQEITTSKKKKRHQLQESTETSIKKGF